MPGGVKLVFFAQICPAAFGRFHDEIGIQIAVGLLRSGNQINHLIRRPFQFLVRLDNEGICDRFQPFGNIGILKHESIKFTALIASGNFEIFDSVARFGVWHAII